MKYPKVVFLASEGVVVLEADGWWRAVVKKDIPLLSDTICEERDLYSKSPSYLAYIAKFEELHTLQSRETLDRSVKLDRLMVEFRIVLQYTRNDSDSYDSSRRIRMLAETALAVLGL